MNRRTIALFSTIVVAAAGLPPASPAQEDPGETRVLVRAVSRDAKLIGDKVGGARVTIVDVATGDTLARGVTRGGTGDTGKIMVESRVRGATVFDTPGAAGYEATLALDGPTEVEIRAEGPLEFPQAMAAASKRMWLTPGHDLTGEGVVVELHGFIVEVLEPEGTASDAAIGLRARVRMLCSCPTEPDGLWSVERVTARLTRDGEIVAEAPLSFAGETSVYAGEIVAPGSGSWELLVVAEDPASRNFGRTVVPIVVE